MDVWFSNVFRNQPSSLFFRHSSSRYRISDSCSNRGDLSQIYTQIHRWIRKHAPFLAKSHFVTFFLISKMSCDFGWHLIRLEKKREIFHLPRCWLASLGGLEPPAFRLGEPLNICHLCSPMYRKVAIRQAFFVFRVAPCSSKFTDVVRCSSVHFSSFLDFSKKGNKNIFHLPPILALFRAKTHL